MSPFCPWSTQQTCRFASPELLSSCPGDAAGVSCAASVSEARRPHLPHHTATAPLAEETAGASPSPLRPPPSVLRPPPSRAGDLSGYLTGHLTGPVQLRLQFVQYSSAAEHPSAALDDSSSRFHQLTGPTRQTSSHSTRARDIYHLPKKLARASLSPGVFQLPASSSSSSSCFSFDARVGVWGTSHRTFA